MSEKLEKQPQAIQLRAVEREGLIGLVAEEPGTVKAGYVSLELDFCADADRFDSAAQEEPTENAY